MSKHDKTKTSSGLLDMWFGRPKTKGKSHTVNGGRPISADSDSLADPQDLHNEIMRLTHEEVDEKFMDIIEDMNIPKDKRQPLLEKSLDEKRDMILMHFKGKSSLEHRNSRFEKPQDYIDYMRDKDHSPTKIHACLESLRVALTSNPLSWMKDFGEDGINEIVIQLQNSKQNRSYDKIEYECIRCLKAIVNNTWGLNLILKPESHAAIFLLAKCIDPKKPQTMCEAVRLLAGFCLISERNGYEKVLRAISMAHDGAFKNGTRFKSIVDGLFAEYENSDTKRELCCHTLIFINTLTNTPSDLNFRLHLRCEIMRMGLYERLDLLTEIVNTSNNENLTKHFKIFNEIREDDFEEFSQRFDNVRLEMDDMNDCFEVLKNIVNETSSEPYLLSILQHLLYIRDDHLFRPAYFQLIEECVSQIVLHKAGCDPNFESRDFHIDTSVLLDDLAERSRAKETMKIEEYDKKLEMLETARQEAEARAQHLEEKLIEYEATGIMPEKTSKLPKVNIPPPPPMPGMKAMPGAPIPPPPPPMPGGNGMAPPPPPPPPPGMGPIRPPGGNAPPPPPMPGMGPPPPPMFMMPNAPMPQANTLPHYLKPKKKFDADGPMKRANWKAIVPQKLSEKAFWVKCQEEKLASEDIFAGLAAKFSSKPIKKSDKDSVDKPANAKKNVVDLRVLDGKSAQNILILLGGSLKHLSHDQIKQCILRCDTSVLNSNIIQQLIQYLPPPDQLKRLQEIKNTGDELSGAEKFAATLGEIKRLVPRLHSINFKLCVNDMVQDVKPDIVAGTAACEEVKTSKKFAKILELILLFGNYMNSGSKNGQAFGFEISFLTKLTNTKDLDNKQTLLHYMVDTIESKFPELLNFGEELPHVERASRVSLENIQKTMNQMTTSLKNLKSDLENSKVPQSPDDKFAEVMGDFATSCNDQVKVLIKMKDKMESYYKDVGEYFAFDTNKYPMEEFFSDIKTFKELFTQAYRDNVKAREEEEKARRIREAREQAQRHLQDRQQRKVALVDIDAAQTQEGVMDSLLDALQNGSAFGNRDRRKRGQRPAGAERRAQLSRNRSRTRVIPNTFVTAS